MAGELIFYVVMRSDIDYDGYGYNVRKGGFPVELFVNKAVALGRAEELQELWETGLNGDEVFYGYTDDCFGVAELPTVYWVTTVSLPLKNVEVSASLVRSVLSAQPSERERALLLEKCVG